MLNHTLQHHGSILKQVLKQPGLILNLSHIENVCCITWKDYETIGDWAQMCQILPSPCWGWKIEKNNLGLFCVPQTMFHAKSLCYFTSLWGYVVASLQLFLVIYDCHMLMVEARKDDPGADTDQEPGGKNETKLFFLNEGKAGNAWNYNKGKQNQNAEKTWID